MNEKRTENIMGTKPINSLVIGMAVPIMLSMIVQALYNVVDSIFVARLSENALTSVSLIFPIQNLMIAVAVGTAVGMNALLSRRLGEKNYKSANQIAENGIFLAVLSWVVFAILGLTCSNLFMSSFTSNAAVAKDGAVYMLICTLGSVGIFVEIMMERILQVTGKTIYQMTSQMTGALVNIVLDPILIFGLFGMPKMGVAGAAIATVIGQWVSMFVALAINVRKNNEIHMSLRGFRPNWHAIKGIYQVGLPSIIMQSIGSVMVFGMNKILISFTETATAVFGVYFKLQSFVFMPVFGVTNAMVPIIGFNYGAHQRKRIVQTIRISMIISVSIMMLGTALFIIAPDLLLSLFQASDTMLAIGVPALRIIAISFAFAGIDIVLSCVFQSLGDGMLSLWMSLVRQLVMLLPSAYLLAKFGGLDSVWYSFLIAEIVALMMSLLFYRHIYRTKLAHIDE